MSVVVKCVVSVTEKDNGYGGGNNDAEVFTVTRLVTTTGKFSETPKLFLDNYVTQATAQAAATAHEQLTVLKGAQ